MFTASGVDIRGGEDQRPTAANGTDTCLDRPPTRGRSPHHIKQPNNTANTRHSANVALMLDGGPTLKQHWFNVSFLPVNIARHWINT